jgi:hypothetical protein
MILPPRFKNSAASDARAIVEAAAVVLSSRPNAPARIRVELPGNGQDSNGLAWATAHAVASNTRGR